MKHLLKFNEEFVKRLFNKTLGKPLSLSNPLTNGYESLETKHLKYLIDLLQGKNKQFKPSKRETFSDLSKIQKDLKKIIDEFYPKSHWPEYKKGFEILKINYDRISEIIKNIPEYDKEKKDKYDYIASVLKEIYKVSYDEGN